MRDYVVTELVYRGKRLLIAALFEERVLQEIRVEDEDVSSCVSIIYCGITDSISANIGGAFIRIGDMMTFLPLPKKHNVRVSHPIAVQVTKDASGLKAPVVTTNFHLSGKYAVLSLNPGKPAFSKKITPEQKRIIESWLGTSFSHEHQLLVRTNAVSADKYVFLAEAESLNKRMESILEALRKAKAGDLLYSPEPFYLTMLRDAYTEPERIFTDIPGCASEIARQNSTDPDAVFFEQGARSLSLAELYGIPAELDRLTGKKIWLRCGGYLIIEKTEAFVSIDVNTGKCTKGRIPEETYRKINLEAAEEIARQIRLRNLSGMILVDFISLSREEHREELLGVMRKLIKKDHIHTEAVDITPLGIMEIIRQKVRKPLEEEIGL